LIVSSMLIPILYAKRLREVPDRVHLCDLFDVPEGLRYGRWSTANILRHILRKLAIP
jgi:hypothetical protein